MTIPDYQSIMLPLLKILRDNKEYSRIEIINKISELFNLSEEEKKEKLPSGVTKINNRVGWAQTYLKKANLITYTRRGYMQITKTGLTVLSKNPEKIDNKFLEQFPEFLEFKNLKKESSVVEEKDEKILEEKTPDELLEKGYDLMQASLKQELLDKLRSNTPDFFEKVVLKFLEKMGYGEGKVTGQTGDGGIDGIVNQDELGLDKILFQAKRFKTNNPVTASMIRDFVGALELNGITKGVFITTSKFPKNSKEIISGSHKSIALINGNKLVELMIEHNLGVTTEKIYNIKKINLDFFSEE